MMAVDPTIAAAGDVVQFFKALSDETRLSIVRRLTLTDLRVGELVAELCAPANVVSYHLKQLRAIGILRDQRSSADGRDVYYGVDVARLTSLYAAAGLLLTPVLGDGSHDNSNDCFRQRRPRLLYLCTHNSARSQLAEAITRHVGGEQIEVVSAGSTPTSVHPLTRAVLAEIGVDTNGLTAKALDSQVIQPFDCVVTVCDRIREICPVFPADPMLIHWSIPDPAAVTDPTAQHEAFRQVRDDLLTRARLLVSVVQSGYPSSNGMGNA